MSFRKQLGCSLFAIGLTIAGGAFAQSLGLPVADTASGVPQDLLVGTAGFTYRSGDENLFALRGTYAVTPVFRIFGDFGTADIRPTIQVGGIYAFKTGLAVDLAARTALYTGFTHDYDVEGFDTMALASIPLQYIGSYVYGGLGLNIMKKVERNDFDSRTERGELDLSAAFGAIVYATEQLSFYLETAHVNDFSLGGGVRYQF